jgi:hypothetical protein
VSAGRVGGLAGGVVMLLGVGAALWISKGGSGGLDVLAGAVLIASIVLGIVVAGVATRYADEHWF